MLCLADQVIGHYPGVRRVVGNDPNLSGPGYLINPHSAEQLSLGLCHKLVPWTNNNVGLGSSEQSEGESCNALQRISFTGNTV